MDSQLITIQHQRAVCATKIADFSARGPELSRLHHERIVASTLLTFTTLYKLAVLVRGDYDGRNSGNPENPELNQICTEFTRVAKKGEDAGSNGLDAISAITQAMVDCRDTEIANLIKSVEDGHREANNTIDAAKEQKRILQSRLSTAQSSLQSTQEALSGTEDKLRDTQAKIREFDLAKDISWIFPLARLGLEGLDQLLGIERNLESSMYNLRNIINEQAQMVSSCQNEIYNTESRIAAATTTVDQYTQILADLDTLKGNCDELLTKSRATEKELADLKTTMRKLFSAAEEILGKSMDANYFTTKAELVGVILDVLEEGYIDDSLGSETELIVGELRASDDTRLFSTPEIQQKVDSLRKKGVSI